MIRCRCGASNTAGRRACATCGAPLALSVAASVPQEPDEPLSAGTEAFTGEEPATLLSPAGPPACASCGLELEPGWRFCKSCGTPVVPGTGARMRHALARMSADGELLSPRALREGRTVIGRTEGELVFPEDGTLSARHAAVVVSGGACEIVDLGSTNGTFVSVRGEEPLEPGDVLLIGSNRLLYRRTARSAEIVEILRGGSEGRRVRLSGARVLLGKDDDAELDFPGDDHVSRRHAEIVRSRTGHALRDLGSTNRTFLIVRPRKPLRDGDRVAVGRQILEYRKVN